MRPRGGRHGKPGRSAREPGAHPPVRVAVVTGAASGIGLRAVERYRSRGVRVVGTDRSPEVATSRGGDDGYVGLVGDVTDAAHLESVVARAVETYGGVDALFHSAGVMPGGAVADVPREQILDVMRVNYGGAVTAATAVLPLMRAQGHGQVVLLGSLTGYVPMRHFAAYSASKAALDMFGEILAHEEAEHGVRVVVAAPNAVKTPLLAQATGGPGYVQRLAARRSSPLLLTPDRVLDAVDRGLRRGQAVVVPGGRFVLAVRRLSPALLWRLTDRIGA